MTQVKQLGRLSLDNPEYVSVHENADAPTPAKLEQVTSPHHPAQNLRHTAGNHLC